MEATTAKAVKPAENAANTPAATTKYSFYQKIFFLYFLNLIDWVCTEALLYSGKFYEANPVMNPVLKGFVPTLLIKGVLPLALTLICCAVYKAAGIILLYIGIIAYAAVNLWHIFNFLLLFFAF